MNATPTRTPTSRAKPTHNWPQWIISGIGIIVSVVIAVNSYLGGVIHRISTCEADYARISQHIVEHEKSAAEWKHRIEQSEDDLRELYRLVRELTQKPSARPDPFTGSMGKALEERIKKLEQKP